MSLEGRAYGAWAQVRRVMELVEPEVESPMESRLRMILVLGGLPRPQVQIELRDAHGNFLGRPDLFYPGARLAIEYDGTTHRANLVADNRRQNRLQKAGYVLLRHTGPDVYNRPQQILEEVRTQLAAQSDLVPDMQWLGGRIGASRRRSSVGRAAAS